jgi:hypothetical protein
MSYILPFVTRYLIIPELFYSEATSQKFNFCIDCEKYLLNPDTLYVIEKAIRNFKKFNTNDTIYEYAMCMECQNKLWDSFSKSSNEKIDEYFSNIDYAARIKKFKTVNNENIKSMISNCIIKETTLEKVNEYQLVALCKGEKLIVHYAPFMISGEAMGEVAELLSNKTLDIIGGLIDNFLGLPPELDKKKKPKLIFI